MSDFLLSQIIVGVGMLFDLTSVQCKERRHLVIGQLIASCLISAHFFVLGVETAGWMFALGASRLLISLKWRNRWSSSISYALLIGAVAYSYSGYLSILGGMASLLMAIGVFSTELRRLRLLFIAGSSTWLIHNLIVWSPVAILMEICFLSSNLIGFYRHEIKSLRKQQPDSGD